LPSLIAFPCILLKLPLAKFVGHIDKSDVRLNAIY
jgi:hypothetical protein